MAERGFQYEWKAITLLTLAFGLVGIDRFALNILFPSLREDLGLTYQDLGNASAALALSWGFASMFMGQVVDKRGVRAVLIPAVVIFSLMAGFSGLAWGMASLLAFRILMGLAEGAFMPASISATLSAAAPQRKAFIFGLQQNGLSAIGLGIGPIIITAILALTGSWRLSFVLVALPGLLIAWLLYRVIQDDPVAPVPAEAAGAAHGGWLGVLRYPNVATAVAIMCCMAGALNIVLILTPSYLVDVLKLTSSQMGVITSATGAGALIGGLVLPALSDRIGRKPVILLSAVAALAAMALFRVTGAQPVLLFIELALICGFCFSVIFITVGPLTSESVPPHVAASAAGIVVGAGEIIGGGLVPIGAGFLADRLGLSATYMLAMAVLAAATIFALMLRAPERQALPA